MWESFRHLWVSEGIFCPTFHYIKRRKARILHLFWLMRVKRIHLPEPYTKKGLPLTESPFLRL